MNRTKRKALSLSFLTIVLSLVTLGSSVLHPISTEFIIERVPNTLQQNEGLRIARGWTTTELVFNESTRVSLSSEITVDKAGNMHLVWYDTTNYNGSGTDADIFYQLWNATTRTWAPVEVLSLEHPGTSIAPSIAVDEMGNIHLAWRDDTNYSGAGTDCDIFYKRWNATTRTWSPTVVISNISDDTSADSAITVDAQSNLHVVWNDLSNYNGSGSDLDVFYRCWNATTNTWTITQVLSIASTVNSGLPSLAVDANETIHVVWQEDITSTFKLFYTYWNTTSKIWSNATLISTESVADARWPQIAIDDTGYLHLIWTEDALIYYKRRNATTGNWTTSELVSTENGGTQPTLTTDGDGNVHVAWWAASGFDGSGPDGDIFYKYWNATSGNWTHTEVISTESTGTSQKPTIAVDRMGTVHIAWEDATNYLGAGSDYDIFYKKTVWLPEGPVLDPILPNPDLDGVIHLNWSAVANATSYYVYRELSLFTAIGGRTPIGSTSLTNYTDTILVSETYYYAVVASNGTHNSSLSNCESVLVQLPDTLAPQYFNAVEGWSSPQNYTIIQRYQFNLTITDDVGLGTVFFEWNGTNYTVSTHEVDEYYYELVDLAAGTYQYRWVFNDTSNNWNATLLKPYIINKATPNINLLFNGSSADYQTNVTWYCNLTIIFPLADTVYLYINESLMDSGPAPLVNVSQFNQLGVYNVTAWYPGGANYSAMAWTRWLTVVDGIPPGPCNLNITYPYLPNFVLENTLFELWGGTDSGSGISHYQYRIDTGLWITAANFTLAGVANGPHVVFYRAVDVTGNNGTVQNTSVYLLASNADYDQDGLTNAAELHTYGTDLFNPDTDGDGIADGVEIASGSNPLDPTDPLLSRVFLGLMLIGGTIAGVALTGVLLKGGRKAKPTAERKVPLKPS